MRHTSQIAKFWFLSIALLGVFNSFAGFQDSLNFYSKTSDYDRSLKFLQAEAPKYSLTNDSLCVEFLIAFGKVSYYITQNDSALLRLEKALQIAEKLENRYLIAKSKVQLIDFFRAIGEHGNALTLIEEVKNNQKINEPLLLCRFFNRTAAVYNEAHYHNQRRDFLDTAELYSLKSLAIAKKHRFLSQLITCYNELGNISDINGNLELSLNYYDSVLLVNPKIDNDFLRNTLRNKGHVFSLQANYDSAIYYCKQALKLSEFIFNPRFLVDNYRILKRSYYGLGDSLRGLKAELNENKYAALHYRNLLKSKVSDLTEKYNGNKKDALIAETSADLVIERKNKQGVILTLILVSILVIISLTFYLKSRRKNQQLAILLQENDFLMAESNHRIKNNLQLIVSLIGRELLKQNVRNKQLEEISDKIKSIAILHQQLYLGEAKEKIDLRAFLEKIKDNFKRGMVDQDVCIDIKSDEVSVKIEKAVYIGLLVTELITNSLKHAFLKQEEKKIKIQVEVNTKQIELTYRDNGSGLKKSDSPSLVNLLIKQIKAEVIPKNIVGYSLFIKFKL